MIDRSTASTRPIRMSVSRSQSTGVAIGQTSSGVIISMPITDRWRNLSGRFLVNVRPVEEVPEQDGVGRVKEDGDSYGEEAHLAGLVLQERFDGEVIEQDAHKHLGQLNSCDGLRHPLGRDTPTGTEGVISVHDGVDGVVDDSEPNPRGDGIGIAVPAVDEDSDVVVPVQDHHLLLAQDNERSVKQLRELGEREQKGPNAPAQ